MAQYARRFLWAGVKIVGGCCGTTAGAHQGDPQRSALACSRTARSSPSRWKSRQRQGRKRWRRFRSPRRASWARKLAAGKFVAFVEILPPRGVDASKEIEGAKLCADARHRLHQRAGRSARQRPAERSGHLPAHPAAGRHRSRAALLLPRSQHSQHPERTAGRAHGRRPQSDLHHRRSAAHGHVSGRDRGVRRRCDRARQHRQQSEPRAGYRRQSDGLANRAAAGRGRESRRAQHGRRDAALRMEGRRPARSTLSRSRSSIWICWKRSSSASSTFKHPGDRAASGRSPVTAMPSSW